MGKKIWIVKFDRSEFESRVTQLVNDMRYYEYKQAHSISGASYSTAVSPPFKRTGAGATPAAPIKGLMATNHKM